MSRVYQRPRPTASASQGIAQLRLPVHEKQRVSDLLVILLDNMFNLSRRNWTTKAIIPENEPMESRPRTLGGEGLLGTSQQLSSAKPFAAGERTSPVFAAVVCDEEDRGPKGAMTIFGPPHLDHGYLAASEWGTISGREDAQQRDQDAATGHTCRGNVLVERQKNALVILGRAQGAQTEDEERAVAGDAHALPVVITFHGESRR